MSEMDFEANILEFEVHNQILKRIDSQEIVNKNHNLYKCRFTFEEDSEWSNLNKFAVFTDGWGNTSTQHLGRSRNVVTCKIPDSALKGSYFKISVYAGDLVTTNNVSVLLVQSGYKKHHFPNYGHGHYHPDPKKPHLYNPHPYHRNFHTECDYGCFGDDKDLWVEIFDNFNTMVDSIIYDNKTLHFFNKDDVVESIYLPFVDEEEFPLLVRSLVEDFVENDLVSSENNGLMLKEDKIKLDSVEEGANKTIVDDSLSLDSNNPIMNSVITLALNGKEDAYDFVERMDGVIQDLIDNGE